MKFIANFKKSVLGVIYMYIVTLRDKISGLDEPYDILRSLLRPVVEKLYEFWIFRSVP